MKKPQFAENQIYHIYNRGVEKRKKDKKIISGDTGLLFDAESFSFNAKTEERGGYCKIYAKIRHRLYDVF